MKKEKGITLASLLVYIVAMAFVVGIVGTMLGFYNSNVASMKNTGEINLELNKFETKMLQEAQTGGNKVVKATENTIQFKSGNIYTYENECIYQNAILVASNVKEFTFRTEQEGTKQILKVYILLGKGQEEVVRNLNYVMETMSI